MKIFISWSGERSKQTAEILKKWMKHVIQSVEPFVSSEDIQKGARWSADIAKELQDSNVGILCVTKDNFKAPWLLFEAGALSKAMDKALVVPLLFDLKPSDLSGSPLLQFQVAPFSKEEIKKLMTTMNEISDKKLEDLDEVFEKWYPDLEAALAEISSNDSESDVNTDEEAVIKSSQVLEEILSLSRDNQKLLRISETHSAENLGQVARILESISNQNEKSREYSHKRRQFHPMMVEELLHFSRKEGDSAYGFLIALSFFKDDLPWIYDLGKDLFDVLKSNKSDKQKDEAVRHFKHMLEHTFYFARKFGSINNEDARYYPDYHMMLIDLLERTSFPDRD